MGFRHKQRSVKISLPPLDWFIDGKKRYTVILLVHPNIWEESKIKEVGKLRGAGRLGRFQVFHLISNDEPFGLKYHFFGGTNDGKPFVINSLLREKFELLKLQAKILWLSTNLPVAAVKPTYMSSRKTSERLRATLSKGRWGLFLPATAMVTLIWRSK